VNEIIARQKAAAARLGGDGREANLTQKLLRWLEHMQAAQVGEVARVEKIKPSHSARWSTFRRFPPLIPVWRWEKFKDLGSLIDAASLSGPE